MEFVLYDPATQAEVFRGSYEDTGKTFVSLGGLSSPYKLVTADKYAALPPLKAPPPPVDTGHGVVTFSDDGTRSRSWGDAAVSPLAADRVARHEESLAKLGIALPPPVYAAGTVVVGWGVDNFRTSRQDFDSLPPVLSTLEEVRDLIRAEQRRQVPVVLRTLRLDEHGFLISNVGPIPLERTALRSVLGMMDDIFRRAFPYFDGLPPDIRARQFNETMDRLGATLEDSEAVLRTRTYQGVEQGFALVSRTYGIHDADAIADDILAQGQGFLDDARGSTFYDPESTSFRVEAQWHADRVVDLAAGDVFKLSATYKTNDSAGGGINVDAGAVRNRCRNLIILGEANANVVRRRHRGAMLNIASDIRAGTEKISALVDNFTEDWGLLRKTPITSVHLWGEKFAGVGEALSWAVEQGKIKAELRASVLTEVLLSGWKAEPGNSLADLLNAITRAHDGQQISQWNAERLATAAGELVPVLVRAAS